MKLSYAKILTATYIITIFLPFLFLYTRLFDCALPESATNALTIAAPSSLYLFLVLTYHITSSHPVYLPCGHSARRDSNFCPRCGTPISPSDCRDVEDWPQ